MPDFAAPIARLIDELKHLPGIGQKTAQRLAYHLLRVSPEGALALAEAIRDAKEKIRECSVCNNITDTDPCLYCTNPARNRKTICVVEEPNNILAVEKTRHYSGLYHVLGGALAPLQGVGPEQLKIKSLIERLKNGAVEEIIIATNPTAEGEATAVYLSKRSEEHTSELQSRLHLVCRLLLEKKKTKLVLNNLYSSNAKTYSLISH